jgi:methyl-accepting chemotaxis protein
VSDTQQRQMVAALVLGALMLLAVKAPPEYATAALVFALMGGVLIIFWVGGSAMAIQKQSQDFVAKQLRVLEEIERALQDHSAKQAKVMGDASGSADEMSASSTAMRHQIDELAKVTEESSASVLELSATQEAVFGNIRELSGNVRETVTSIEEMTYSIREVARNVDALALTAEDTASSMNEIDVSIDQVQSNANETAKLSEEVSQDADRGVDAIEKTTTEINRIRESSQEAMNVIATLNSRIEAIGQIVNVIDDVAEQTNLLALNAAIIAAQAGEQGKGFAVVADEIKDLADRAATSTREITDLIKTVQLESKNAIAAVERGARNVDRGVVVSNEAERALKKILDSSQKSTSMVRAIARATVEQAKGSKQITDSIGKIAETVQHIAAATSQQAKGADLIMQSSTKMRQVAQKVEVSTQEQVRGNKQLTLSVERFSNMLHSLGEQQEGQQRVGERFANALVQGKDAATTQREQLRRIADVVERLRDK